MTHLLVLVLGLALLVGGVPAQATHPQACYLDLGPVPSTGRARRQCRRWQHRLCTYQAKLCAQCQAYPGATHCVDGSMCAAAATLCDIGHGCFDYTPDAAECAAGHPLPTPVCPECPPAP